LRSKTQTWVRLRYTSIPTNMAVGLLPELVRSWSPEDLERTVRFQLVMESYFSEQGGRPVLIASIMRGFRRLDLAELCAYDFGTDKDNRKSDQAN
jgi:hypothetical protein